MSISGTDVRDAVAQSVTVSDEALSVDLADGRTITVPLIWFPRLAYGTPAERANWRFIGGGGGVPRAGLDEGISVGRLLGGGGGGGRAGAARRRVEGGGRHFGQGPAGAQTR